MATKKIDSAKLAQTINEYLKEYGEDIQESVEKNSQKEAKDAIKYLKAVSPENTSRLKKRATPYKDGWARKTQKKGRYRYSQVVWNKTNYQLTHLLEFGFTHRDGKHVSAQPHIREAEKIYKEKFVDALKKEIGGKK